MRHALQCAGSFLPSARIALLGLACGGLLLLPPSALAQAAHEDSVLVHHGRLKLRSYSIHGAAPLILVLTEAPGGAASAERRYRATFTALLTRYIEMRGFSYYVFRDSVGGDSMPRTPEQTVARLEASVREVTAALSRKRLPPAAYVGLAEGAVVAARLVTQESLPQRLAALSPSLPTEGPKGSPRWDEVVGALDAGLPSLLAMQSARDGPMPHALLNADRRGQRLLLLPNLDSWLAYMPGTSCPGERPLHGGVPNLSVPQMVAEWLGTSVLFPE